MKRSETRLARLLTLARKAGAELTSELPASPPGFAARVAARWARPDAHGPSVADLWERVCWWGAGAAVAVTVLAVSYQGGAPEPAAFDLLLAVPAEEELVW